MTASTTEIETILIVDDNPHLLKAQARILETAGYRVLQASSGEEGIEITRSHAPGLILLDVILPGIDGMEACRRIKALNNGTYVVLLSALKTGPDEQALGLDSGADGYIARPVANRELLARVRAMLRIKKAETELKRSEQRFRSIIENAGLGIFAVDRKGVIATVNPAFLKMTGFEKTELVGSMPPYPFWPEDFEDEAGRQLKKLLRDGRLDYETTMRKKDGTLFPASEIASSVLDIDGKPESFIIVVQDITEKKQAEESRLRLRKLEAIGSMVGGVAHDLNNLLAIIVGNIDLLEMDAPPCTNLVDSLSDARQACVIARDLVCQYLALSENTETERAPGNIAKVLEDAAKSFSGKTSTEFDISAPGDLRPIRFDPGQIKKAFEELFENAVEAMDGGGTVFVRLENARFKGRPPVPELSEGDYVRISIRDNGRGIPEPILSRIFDPYFSTKDRGAVKGMGFGLAVANAVFSSHDGSIRAASVAGEGTEFVVLLPAIRDNL